MSGIAKVPAKKKLRDGSLERNVAAPPANRLSAIKDTWLFRMRGNDSWKWWTAPGTGNCLLTVASVVDRCSPTPVKAAEAASAAKL